MVRDWRELMGKETDNERKEREFLEGQESRESDQPEVPKWREIFLGRKK